MKTTGMIFIHYLNDRRKVIIGYITVILLFLVVCALYQLENMPKIFYAVIISSFLGLCYSGYDFGVYAMHYRRLWRALCSVEEAVSFLPEPVGLLQEQYQDILRKMEMEVNHLVSRQRVRESEQMDYYMMWAHQIKTPIAAMKLLLQNGPGSSFALSEELFKIESYVEMVLHYLRLENISADMLLKTYDLHTLVKQAVKKYSILFINSKTSLQLDEFAIPVITDEKWISFVLEQVLSNAIKYTPSGKITISAAILPSQAEEQKCRLIIDDNGIGIRAEDLPRIFERGFTGYNGRMDKKATGIGLYLSRQILIYLGHEIQVQSEIGEGTRVSITLLTKM